MKRLALLAIVAHRSMPASPEAAMQSVNESQLAPDCGEVRK